MSRIALEGNVSGTGVFTLASPDGNTNRTLTLPDEAGTVLTSASSLATQTAAALNATGSAPIYACRAWVNFNGTGAVAIRASGNVSSITDNGTGNYYVNLANSMPDTNYSVVITKQNETSNLDSSVADAISSRLVNRIQLYTLETGSVSDSANINVSVFR
jgi:hypothetical protein